MLDADETAELRALQARAYGRDGGLGDADAARLRELETMRLRTSGGVPHGGADADAAPAVESAEPEPEDPVEQASPSAQADPEPATQADPTPLRPSLRRHWRALALVGAGLLVIGLGTGWALFGRGDDGIPLTSEEQQRSAELQSEGDYDPGSVEAIGRDDDAIVWFGTKKSGEMECIVLDVAGDSATGCQIAADLERGYGLSAAVIDSRRSDEGRGEQISATAARSHTGEMVALIQRWALGVDDWMQQFDAAERERAQELLDRGYEPYSLAVVGYAGGAPVWSAVRTEGFTTTQCLIVDAAEATSCAEANDGMIPGEGVMVAGTSVDEGGATTMPWSVTLDITPMGRSYLIVTGELPEHAPGDGAPTGTTTVRPGESLEVGGEHGDPIPVDVPPGDAG
ncbi:hypothetical protein [Microbacterium sp.]|uniref:hypothetical protein n=1 Tax=Microbacterium sp. TaxID=51671 RepID=UPI00289F8567|nr:hypothetical protein [Microbacterium sp.]